MTAHKPTLDDLVTALITEIDRALSVPGNTPERAAQAAGATVRRMFPMCTKKELLRAVDVADKMRAALDRGATEEGLTALFREEERRQQGGAG
jgi:hypothetical protein